jgi:hypothetical protein
MDPHLGYKEEVKGILRGDEDFVKTDLIPAQILK